MTLACRFFIDNFVHIILVIERSFISKMNPNKCLLRKLKLWPLRKHQSNNIYVHDAKLK